MLSFTLLGALCMVGTLWLVVYARSSTRAGALTVAVLAVYAWSLLSMLTTLAGTTLLSFRLQPTLTVLLTAAGTFGFIEATRAIAARYTALDRTGASSPPPPPSAPSVRSPSARTSPTCSAPTSPSPTPTPTATASAPTGARPAPRGTTRRSTRRSATATGRPRNETVVMTADYSFLSYLPYYGFQGLTSHYANPLAQFKERSAAIEGWATLTKPDQFIASLDGLPWQPPTVFLMRHGANDTYTLRLASDVYPNQPNVRRYQVALDAALFDDPRWDVSDIGPFVLAIRK